MVRTQYVKSEGVSLAYRVSGEGEVTLLQVPGAVSNLALEHAFPANARYLERLSRFCRVVRFDKRGCGFSDRSATPPTVPRQVPDVEGVRAATESERVALYGLSQGAAVAVLYALAFPSRITHLILVSGISCDARDPYGPACEDNRLTDWSEFFADLEDDFEAFTYKFAGVCFPAVNEATQSAIADYLRATAGPAVFEGLWRGIVGFDLRPVLKDLSVPTLVIHSREDQHHPVAHGRYFGEHILGARYLELDSAFHVPHLDPAVQPQMLVAIEEFLTGTVRHSAERRLTIVLFTDIVDSTVQQRAQGDHAWRNVRQLHEASTRRITEQFGGRLVEIEGDGAMMEFQTAGEALRAARTQVDAARELGIHIRAGLHAGEVYEVEGKLLGLCVNVAARVTAQARADEILTTEVVRGLVEGSDLAFADAGGFDLKGIGVRRLSRLL